MNTQGRQTVASQFLPNLQDIVVLVDFSTQNVYTKIVKL